MALDHDALRTCVHCGICLPQCPTYRLLGEEMDSPRGRVYLMRAAAEGRITPTRIFARHIDLCLGCRACETACPSGVPFGSLLEATRAELRRRGLTTQSPALAKVICKLFPHPDRLRLALRAARIYQRTGLRAAVRASRLLRIAPRLAAMEALLPDVPTAGRLRETIAPRGPRVGRAALLLGCVQRHLYPHVHRDTIRLLTLAGWEVSIPRRQGCCGALDLHAGRLGAYRARARALASLFRDADVVVTNAAGCGSAMRDWAHWLPEEVAADVARRVRDVTQVLVDADLPLGPLHLTVTYHDACHLVHGQKVRAEPRALLERIPGLRLVPLADSDLCCGSAGVYNLVEPEMADRLLEMKLARIAETGAPTVVTGNPGCLLQIAKGARARGLDLDVLHPVELLMRSVNGSAN
ncbi:MAG TPA: heterodisulfide reductase-related iron-sulfur binding cluster [Methylomirabilota bacterium]|nr:heterodisulfide reductase-related iron-sulfur binding cluster [Methylomirabilota bacterium]